MLQVLPWGPQQATHSGLLSSLSFPGMPPCHILSLVLPGSTSPSNYFNQILVSDSVSEGPNLKHKAEELMNIGGWGLGHPSELPLTCLLGRLLEFGGCPHPEVPPGLC